MKTLITPRRCSVLGRIGLTCATLALALHPPLSAAEPAEAAESPIAGISGYSPATLKAMEEFRITADSTGGLYIPAAIVQRGLEYQKILKDQGIPAVADQLLAVYGTDEASMEFAGATWAALIANGYSYKVKSEDKGLNRKVDPKGDPDEEGLANDVLALVDEIVARNHPHAADAAVELLLQAVSESLPAGHAYMDNGRRAHPPMPEKLVARAADYLDHEDPFVRAMAEWAISVKVSIDNDRGDLMWPGENPPDWYQKWMAIPAEAHLPMDYARQAISLMTHRRGNDLLKLAADLQRRAQEKAAWAQMQYGGSNEALDAMNAAFAELQKQITENPENLTAQRQAWLDWRATVRPVVLGTGDMDFEKLVYIKRYSGGHHIQPSIHMNKYPAGGDVYVQTGFDPDSPAQPLIKDQLPEGYVQDLDLWYDADKLVISRTDGPGRNTKQKLFSLNIDGSNIEKLTDTNHHDVDPVWLPDGSVVFGSTRCGAGIMCGGGGYAHTNIYRLLADRSDVIRLTYNKDDDAYPAVLNDGRVVYMRWDYQERGVDEIFSLWVIRPDGAGSDGFYRVHIPDSLIIQALKNPRAIPGTQKLIAEGSSHRAGNEGMVALADLKAGINNPEGITAVTPYHSPIGRGVGTLMRPVDEGGVPYIGGYYMKPEAITEKTFVTSATYNMPSSCNFQGYYIDVWGNKELLHRDKMMEVVALTPLRPRPKPPVLPETTDRSKTYATCYVDNVYRDLPGIEPGSVKYLRILEQLFWFNGAWSTAAISYDSFRSPSGTGQGLTRIIGIVPVKEDGSAMFQVPSDAPLYFQALDENFMGVQRMRTHVEFAPGEYRSCIGCHETRDDAVSVRPSAMAMGTEPLKPVPPPWGDTTFLDFEKHIQPILDAKCVECHSGDEPDGGVLFSKTKDEYGYMQSFRTLFGLKPGESFPEGKIFNGQQFVNAKRGEKPDHPWFTAMYDKVAFFFKETNGEVTQPLQFGSPQVPWAQFLVKDEKHAKLLNPAELETLMTWLDVRAPYWSHYVTHGKGNQPVQVNAFEPFGEIRDHELVVIEGEKQ